MGYYSKYMGYSLILKRLFLCLMLMNHLTAKQWTEPYNTYLFAPGIISSEHQAAKYCSEYKASTGQKVISKHGYELMNGVYCRSCNFAEISLVNVDSLHRAQASWLPHSLVMNQIYKIAHSILTTSNNRYSISIEGQPRNGLTLNPYLLNFFKINFGQMQDIAILSTLYDQCCNAAELPKDIILFGTSRGAASIINFMALEYFKKSQKRVKAIILEGCYNSFDNLTNFSFLLSLISSYTYHGIAPINSSIIKSFVWNCNHYTIPILFVTSDKDTLAPSGHSYALCNALQQSGLKDLYVLKLKNSVHSGYLKDKEDAYCYETTMHAFYQANGLSHDPNLAQQGKKFLEESKI
jgi:hypothetical protein